MDTDGTAHLVTVPTTGDAPPEEAVLLGEADGVAYWAVRDPPNSCPGRTRWTARTCAPPAPPWTRSAPGC